MQAPCDAELRRAAGPGAIFWGREPEHGPAVEAGLRRQRHRPAVRKFFIVLLTARNVWPLRPAVMFPRIHEGRRPGPAARLAQAHRAIHFHFCAPARRRSPESVRGSVVIEGLLNTGRAPGMEQRQGERTRRWQQTRRAPQEMAEEICATTRGGDQLLERFCGCSCGTRVQGIDVQALDACASCAVARDIYLRARSHATTAGVFVLYHAGLVPPTLAAGENSTAGVGCCCGAARVFLRRNSAGPPVLRAVPRLHGLADRRGWSLEFLPEAVRSRTGRLLTPKKGCMAICRVALRSASQGVVMRCTSATSCGVNSY